MDGINPPTGPATVIKARELNITLGPSEDSESVTTSVRPLGDMISGGVQPFSTTTRPNLILEHNLPIPNREFFTIASTLQPPS